MNNYESISSIISSFSGQERHFSIPRVYVELVSDFNTAILLNQIVFWSDKSKRKDGYFYKSYVEWEEETTLTEYQIRRSSKVLKDMGIVETVLKKANGSPTLHYKVNMDKLSESILKKLKNRNLRNLSNHTEETEETITVDDAVDDTVDDRSINKIRLTAERIYDSYIKNRKTEKNKTIKRIQTLIKRHGEEKITRAVERYKLETAETEVKYIKMSSGFFVEDYIGRLLEDDYEPPIKAGQPTDEPKREYRVLK